MPRADAASILFPAASHADGGCWTWAPAGQPMPSAAAAVARAGGFVRIEPEPIMIARCGARSLVI